MVFKQFVEMTFVTTATIMFSNKPIILYLILKLSSYIVMELNYNMVAKIMPLKGMGHKHRDTNLCLNLFIAYKTASSKLCKAHVKILEMKYNIS